MKKTIALILAVAIFCGICGVRIGYNMARKDAQLVEVNAYGYIIKHGDFYDTYKGTIE